MGHLAITDMLDHTDADTALVWHLQSNHYPPVPAIMVPVCRKAIDYANEGDWNALVALPDGVSFRGWNAAPAHAIVEAHHLHAFIAHELHAFLDDVE